MKAQGLTPILNVSDMQATFRWFETLGWQKGFEWGEPTSFASVCFGECQIFLCLHGQGGKGRGTATDTFADYSAEAADKGVWMSVWLQTVAEVDATFELCKQTGIEITHEPEDMPWGVRELHIRHPDGHVFRVGCGTGGE